MSVAGIPSYPSIYNIGHKAVLDITNSPVLIEEKVDGSQISFGIRDDGTLMIRSKGAPVYDNAPQKMFQNAVYSILERKDRLHVGWTYRGEYLSKPKHNCLAYDRIPKGSIVVFDINPGEEQYLTRPELEAETTRIDLEFVPRLFEGMITGAEQFRALLQTKSFLGGPLVEGVVIKPLARDRFGLDKKLLMAKFVSEAFKEVHAAEWKTENPKQGDIIQALGVAYRTPARWMKAVQHLKEAGKLEDSSRDIGLLIREIPDDIAKECTDAIKQALWDNAWPHIRRVVTAGMPEWYKEELLKRQFEIERKDNE